MAAVVVAVRQGVAQVALERTEGVLDVEADGLQLDVEQPPEAGEVPQDWVVCGAGAAGVGSAAAPPTRCASAQSMTDW